MNDDETTKRVWVVSELYYPEETSTGGSLTILAEGLAKTFRVGVLCSQPTYNARGLTAPWYEERHGTTIHRCVGTRLNKDILVFRVFNLLTISLGLAILAFRRIRTNDSVIVVTNPPLLPFLITAVCRVRRAKALLLIHDVYPETLTITDMLSPTSIIACVLDRATRHLYRNVDRIIVLGRDMEALVRHKLQDVERSVVTIPNCPHEPDRIRPTPRGSNALLKRLGLVDKFVIQYSGNIGRTHGLKVLVEAAQRLTAVSEIHFLFIGWGAKKRWLEASVESLGLANVTVLPYVPREELATSLNACDVAIISFVPGMIGSSVPGRMYNIMAAGKAILAVTEPKAELGLVVQEERIGWVVPPGNATRLVETILEAKANPRLIADMGRRARALVETKYSVERVIDQYTQLLDSVSS
jgi:glycosyltransferase involved in cell wall biosynthesis